MSRLSSIEPKRCEFSLRMVGKHGLECLRVFHFNVVWSSKENKLVVGILHQVAQNRIRLDLLPIFLHYFLKFIDTEILHPFVGDLRMRESQFILSEKIDKRSYAGLVLVALFEMGLPFSLHPLLVLLTSHFLLLARHPTNNKKRVFSIMHIHIITHHNPSQK